MRQLDDPYAGWSTPPSMPQPPWATQTSHFAAIPQPLEVPPTPSSTAASEIHPPMWRHTDPDL
eukprot:2230513-Pleurochrysis_carterae.AAC.1